MIIQMITFLLLAAALGVIIGWLWRGARFQNELADLDVRWRSKLTDVEGERDRLAGEATQANEAKATLEASTAEAQRLVETQESTLYQLRREHETKLDLLANTEQRAGSLEEELAAVRASFAEQQQGADGDSERLSKELAAATAKTETLERDLHGAKEANSACKQEVERLQARIADLQRAGESDFGSGVSGGALGLMSSPGSSTGGGQTEPAGYVQPAPTTPIHLAETGSQGFSGSESSTSSTPNEESEGTRPEPLSEPRGGIADDLKKISGVGPKLEKTLNGLGFFHFSQIAAFTPEHVAWVDRNLRFKGRIERENWIEQAKILAAGGETEFSKRK